MKLLSIISVLLLTSLPQWCSAKKVDFELDPTIGAQRPMCYKSVRVISSKYSDIKALYYYLGKPRELSTNKTLVSQMGLLLSNNACTDCSDEAALTVVVHDFKFYDLNASGEVINLYMNVDFFTGKSNALHHIYSLDTMFQRRQKVFKKGYSAAFVSEAILQAAGLACNNMSRPSATTYTDEEADQYYENTLKRFPLYTTATPPLTVYRTASDFSNLRGIDTPLIFEHIPQIEGDGFNWFFYKTAEGKKGKQLDADDYYAATDGKNYWFSYDGTFHKLTRKDGEFFITVAVKNLKASEKIGAFGALGYFASMAVDEQFGAKDGGQKEMRPIMVKFSPVRKAFVRYGGTLPNIR